MKPISMIAIVGPTASGKSALALRLAERLSGEIVSCDSMQVYRGMDIGTAKASSAERLAVPHHLIDVADPRLPYSAADYAGEALAAVREIASRGRLPILCGGTGLYLEALRRGRHGDSPGGDAALRCALMREGEQDGGREALHARLAALDPDATAAIHPNNLRRVVRALELCLLTGKTKTALDAEGAALSPELRMLVLRLAYTDRALLTERIDRRVDEMMEAGLIDEVRGLREAGMLPDGSTAAEAIGYKELYPYLDGAISRDEAAKAIKLATRQYAKRQDTWFRRTEGAVTLTGDEGGAVRSLASLVDEAETLVLAHLAGKNELINNRKETIP